MNSSIHLLNRYCFIRIRYYLCTLSDRKIQIKFMLEIKKISEKFFFYTVFETGNDKHLSKILHSHFIFVFRKKLVNNVFYILNN